MERRINDEKVEQAIALCCGENVEAQEYLRTMGFVARVIDDLIDGDYEVRSEDIYKTYHLLLTLPLNDFYAEHCQILTGAQMIAHNAWIDSNKMTGSALQKAYAHVIRDFVNELCPMVAQLTGGYKHMRDVSIPIRNLFLKEVD